MYKDVTNNKIYYKQLKRLMERGGHTKECAHNMLRGDGRCRCPGRTPEDCGLNYEFKKGVKK